MARVRLFANLREMAGASHTEVEGKTVGDVAAALAARYGPDFDRRLQAARIWKNGEEAVSSDTVAESDELAVIPPVSGGATAGRGSFESISLVVMAVLLLVANALDTAVLAAVWVGAVALWVVDLTQVASEGDFKIDFPPILAAVLVSVSTSITFGAPGLGIGAVLSVFLVMGWAVIQPRARDLTAMAASVLCASIASLATGSILLARASTEGGRKIAGLLIVVAVGALMGRIAERSRARLIDPYLIASIVTVLAALAVAFLSSFDLLGWFFIGLVLAAAMIAGRGIGSAFRMGRIQLSVRPDGSLTGLDSPMAAAAVFMPIMWLVY